MYLRNTKCDFDQICFFFSATHLSFSFAFFVHGESTVCASVDVRQHPPVRRLCRSHLQQAQTSSSGLQGIKTFSIL